MDREEEGMKGGMEGGKEERGREETGKGGGRKEGGREGQGQKEMVDPCCNKTP